MEFFQEHPMFILDYQSLDILEVSESAINKYGLSYEEFLSLNIADVGKETKNIGLVKQLKHGDSNDKVWLHQSKSGQDFYVQFTSHLFNFKGEPSLFVVAHDVTELVNRSEKDHHYFPKIRSKLAHSPLSVVEWDNNLTVKNWSKSAEELFGWKEEEVVDDESFFNRFVHSDELDDAHRRFDEVKENQTEGYIIEGRNYTKDGKIIHCEWYNSALFDKDGELVSVFALVRDISDRKQSENMFRALSEESLVGVYLIQDWAFQYVNPRFEEIFGYNKQEIEQKMSLENLAHPEDRKDVKKNIQHRISEDNKSIKYSFKGQRKNGQTLYLNMYGTHINYNGKPAVVGTLVDITNNKLAYERYHSSIESFEDLFDSISDAIYIQNKAGELIEVNQGAVEMYGYQRDEFIGRKPKFLAAPGKVDLKKTNQLIEKALEGEPQQFEWWGRKKNGEVFPKEIVANPGTYFGEKVVITIARDVSERYEAQEKIRRNEELFRQLFQNAHVGIVMLDTHYEIKMVNNAFEEMFGYSQSEIKGISIDQLIVPGDDSERAQELSEDSFWGKSSGVIAKRIHKDGSLVDVLIYGVPVIVDEKTHAIFGMYVDITDRAKAEQKLRKSLREKEVLLAEIHHRVKNNLAVVTGLLELQSNKTSQKDARDILQESRLRINSIALIHEKLYQNKDLAQISFDDYIKELTGVVVESLTVSGKQIDLSIYADPVFLTVNQAIPCGLILNELITNSYKHAFPKRKSGKIEVFFKQQENEVLLKVQDNGIGIPENIAMDKPESLGITLVQTLTKQLKAEGGYLDSGEGTTFELLFDLKRKKESSFSKDDKY